MRSSPFQTRRSLLSAAIIVRNEQEVIRETLDSVRAIADEIIVWDCGSTDDTVSLAQECGAKVYQNVWRNNFSVSRNACMDKVTSEWVLWLDAGEKLVDDSARKLREFVDSSAGPKRAYLLMVRVPPATDATLGEQIAQPRLLPAKAGLKFEGRVRETLYPSIARAGLEIDTAPATIVRHPRQHLQERKTRIANRNLGLVELELAEKGRPNPRLALAEGEAHVNLGNYDKARNAFISAIELSRPDSTEMLEGYYGLLTGYNNDPALRDAQLTAALNALEAFPLDSQLLLAVGSYFQMCKRLDLATKAFETAVRFGQTNTLTWHLCELPEVAASCLAMALQLQGKGDDACHVLQDALTAYRHSPRLQKLALDLYIQNGDEQRAVALAKQTGVVAEPEDPVILAIKGACKAARQEWTPALAYLQSAYLLGCHNVLCLRWLAVTLLSGGQDESVQPILAQWQELEPANPELLAYIAALKKPQDASGDRPVPWQSETKPPAIRQYRVDSVSSSAEFNPIKIPLVPNTGTKTSLRD